MKLPIESTTVTVDGQERTLALVQVNRPAGNKILLRPRKKSTPAAATTATSVATPGSGAGSGQAARAGGGAARYRSGRR